MFVLKYAYIVREDKLEYQLPLSNYCILRFFSITMFFRGSSRNLYAFISKRITDNLSSNFCNTHLNDNRLLKPFYKYIKE